MNYNCDTRYGLIYEDHIPKIKIDKYRNDNIKNLRFKMTENLISNIENKKQIIDVLQICPAGSQCEGDCEYCYNKFFDDLGNDFINEKRLIDDIEYLQEHNGTPPVLEIAWTGGEYLLHDDVLSLIKIIQNKYKNSDLNMSFMVSCFYDDTQLERLDTILQYIMASEQIKRICLNITMDLDGSNYRRSFIKKMNNTDAIEVGFKIIRKYKHADIMLNICTKITNACDPEIYLNNIDRIEAEQIDNTILRLGNIEGPMAPSPELLQKTLTYIKNKRGLFFPEGMRCLYTNIDTKLSKALARKRMLNLMELEDGIYCAHPFEARCWSGIRTLTIVPKGYSICQYSPFVVDTIEEAMNKKTRLRCGITQPWCNDCEYQGFCNLCCFHNCNDDPSRKIYWKEALQSILDKPETWFITKNVFKERME